MVLKRLLGDESDSGQPSSQGPPDPSSVPDDAFETVAKTTDLAPGEMKYVEVGRDYEPIVLINYEGDFFALTDTCTHEEASLSDGQIIGDEIECPLHGGAFEIRTGAPAAFPVVVAAKMFPVRVVGKDIQIANV